MVSLQAFLSFLPRASESRLPLLTPATQAKIEERIGQPLLEILLVHELIVDSLNGTL